MTHRATRKATGGSYDRVVLGSLSPATTFFGRVRELEALHGWFAGGDRLVTLLGPAGTGKTRLALRFAELHPKARCCDLTDARDAAAVSDAVEAMVATLGDETLLVLDNCEHVAHAVATVVPRIPAGTRILVTSRERLRVPGERCFEVPPLGLPQRGDDATASEALQLFLDRARLVRPDYALTAPDTEVLVEILERLDGLPLAIELAAARMRVLSPQALLRRLSLRFDLLRSDARDATTRQRTLRGALDWSWDLLEPVEQSALAQCSVFRSGFTLEAAEAVLDLSPHVGAPATLEVIESLCDKSLVRTLPRAGDVRFGLYECIREYAAERLGDEIDRVRERHGAYFLAFGRDRKSVV